MPPVSQVYLGDCFEVLQRFPDNRFDACVTDPPYGLGEPPDALEMLKDWLDTGHHDKATRGKGFMGKSWDSFIPQPAVWREVYRVMKPGANILCFAGTRTMDLMGLALRIAGFECRDCVMWCYGQGFPKSYDISKGIDKALGAERKVVGTKTGLPGYSLKPDNEMRKFGVMHDDSWVSSPEAEVAITAPATDAAKLWDGWGTALKPSFEPIILAMKPCEGTYVANALKWGVAGLNIDGCRIETADFQGMTKDSFAAVKTDAGTWNSETHGMLDAGRRGGWLDGPPTGRWPANLIHDGSEEVLGCFPAGAPKSARTGLRGGSPVHGQFGIGSLDKVGHRPADPGGSAARFFYCAKASVAEREAGLEELESTLRHRVNPGGLEHDPRWAPVLRKNDHPTLKPISLMRYLCRLACRPGGLILDPFCGTGSTGCAAMQEGFGFVGIEQDQHYVQIARLRIKHWAGLAQKV